MTDFLDRDPLWGDISEFELPTSLFNGSEHSKEKNIYIIAEKIIRMLSHLSQVAQFRPRALENILITEAKISYFESNLAISDNPDDKSKLLSLNKDLIGYKRELFEVDERIKMLNKSIRVGLKIVDLLVGGKNG